jgi:hypothetical protein
MFADQLGWQSVEEICTKYCRVTCNFYEEPFDESYNLFYGVNEFLPLFLRFLLELNELGREGVHNLYSS